MRLQVFIVVISFASVILATGTGIINNGNTITIPNPLAALGIRPAAANTGTIPTPTFNNPVTTTTTTTPTSATITTTTTSPTAVSTGTASTPNLLNAAASLKVCRDDGSHDQATCPAGTSLIQVGKPVPQGCGPAVLADLNSFVKALLTDSMVQCCNLHDVCYSTCGAIRKQCDDLFNQCLQSQQNSQGANALISRVAPPLMHLSVQNFGCQFFDEAQQAMCGCVENPTEKLTEV